mgnify:CR=1 FL=1|jgi:phenylacetate-CoA ligase
MGDYFDELERRAPAARDAQLLEALRRQLEHARAQAPAMTEALAAVDPAEIRDFADLARLPVTRKSEMHRLQSEEPPFGGFAAIAPGEAGRIFVSPGPIYELEARDSHYGRMARAFFAAGFRRGELVHNSFAYHLTPGGWIMDAGARRLGCAVIPAGVGASEQQAQAIAHLRPQGWCGTPDFLKVILDKGAELGLDLSSITKALVSGGALFPSLRQEYAERGITVRQCYATAELGLIAYETEIDQGQVIDEEVILEIVRPGTGDPLPAGEVGEVVVTSLNPAYPLIRFATGDLSLLLEEPSPCGRTNRRIKGWMGRADQTAKVRGMFVRPEQIAAVLRRHPEIRKARLEIARAGESDVMLLRCEAEGAPEGLTKAIAGSLQGETGLRGEVELAAPGSLPNDGKVIDDRRSYE